MGKKHFFYPIWKNTHTHTHTGKRDTRAWIFSLKCIWRTSLVVQWLRLWAPSAEGRSVSLRFHMLEVWQKKKTKRIKKECIWSSSSLRNQSVYIGLRFLIKTRLNRRPLLPGHWWTCLMWSSTWNYQVGEGSLLISEVMGHSVYK